MIIIKGRYKQPIKESYKQPNIINSSVNSVVGDGSINICIEKCELFK